MAHSGRMTQADLVAAMKQFQSAYDRPLDVVDELFEATTDRLWALTSKEQGTFEFEVLSLREYFARSTSTRPPARRTGTSTEASSCASCCGARSG